MDARGCIVKPRKETQSTAKPTRYSRVLAPSPLNYLVQCSDRELGAFEIARLAAVANTRADLHAALDRLIDEMSSVALAQWLKRQNRKKIKVVIVRGGPEPNETATARPEPAKSWRGSGVPSFGPREETPEQWARRQMRDGQRSPEELIPRPTLPPGKAHSNASVRYQKRNIAQNKCRVCPKPLSPYSLEYCEEHLEKARAKRKLQTVLKPARARDIHIREDLTKKPGKP